MSKYRTVALEQKKLAGPYLQYEYDVDTAHCSEDRIFTGSSACLSYVGAYTTILIILKYNPKNNLPKPWRL